jgi:hypothetical protein
VLESIVEGSATVVDDIVEVIMIAAIFSLPAVLRYPPTRVVVS